MWDVTAQDEHFGPAHVGASFDVVVSRRRHIRKALLGSAFTRRRKREVPRRNFIFRGTFISMFRPSATLHPHDASFTEALVRQEHVSDLEKDRLRHN